MARAMDLAVGSRFPLLIVSASGGARQEEGVFALMQMAKTCCSALSPSSVGPAVCLVAHRCHHRRCAGQLCDAWRRDHRGTRRLYRVCRAAGDRGND